MKEEILKVKEEIQNYIKESKTLQRLEEIRVNYMGKKGIFTELSKKITERINTYLRNQERNYKIIDSPLKECDGLQPYEISLLGVIVGEQLSDDVNVSLYLLKDRMLQIGFNETAVGIGIMSLRNKGIIVTGQEPDYHGNEYPVCKLTPRGKDFILTHTNLFELSPLKVTTEKDSSEWELPF